MNKLYVLRHGETEFNKQNRYAGTTDVKLNENGINQARNIAKSLQKISIDIIISSSKKRALKTAQIINEYMDKHIEVSDYFVERNIGVFEGLTRQEVENKYPRLWNRNILHEKDSTEHEGESVNQVKHRVKKGLKIILEKHRGKNILLVTHGYVSRIIYGLMNDVSDDVLNQYLLGNCEVEEYDIKVFKNFHIV